MNEIYLQIKTDWLIDNNRKIEFIVHARSVNIMVLVQDILWVKQLRNGVIETKKQSQYKNILRGH
jgi:hypothetical protein